MVNILDLDFLQNYCCIFRVRVDKCDVLALLLTDEVRSLVDVGELSDSFQNDVNELNIQRRSQEREQRSNLFFLILAFVIITLTAAECLFHLPPKNAKEEWLDKSDDGQEQALPLEDDLERVNVPKLTSFIELL